MPKRTSYLRRLYIPLTAGLLAVLAFCWYEFVWVASQREYFKQRNLRLLATLGQQIQQKVDSFDKAIDNAVTFDKPMPKDPNVDYTEVSSAERKQCQVSSAERKQCQIAGYISSLVPELKWVNAQEARTFGVPTWGADPPIVTVKRDEGNYHAFFVYQSNAYENGQKIIVLKARISEIVEPFAAALAHDFDDLLVARKDGQAIFEWPGRDVQINRLDSLVDKDKEYLIKRDKEKTKGEKADTPDARLDVDALSGSSGVTDAKLGGTDYKLYTQPFVLSYQESAHNSQAGPSRSGEARSKGGEKGAKAQSAGEPSGDLQPEVVWVVCGLLRADRFKADCQAISSSLVIGFSIVLILLLLLTPFFKLSCIGSAERVQSRDGVFLAVSAFLGTGLLTLTLLDLYYYRYKFHKTLHCHLETFADRLNQKVGKEEELISQQLETFSKWHTECFDRVFSGEATKEKAEEAERLMKTALGGKPCSPRHVKAGNSDSAITCWPNKDKKLGCTFSKILNSGMILGKEAPYPYFQRVFWDDAKGWQRIKWDTWRRATPLINMSDIKGTYFRTISTELRWGQIAQGTSGGSDSGKPPAAGVGVLYSPNTGEIDVAYWRLIRPQSRDPRVGWQSEWLVTRPLALIKPVLAGSMEYAVIQQNGTVLFHSDDTRNLQENFLEECDNDAKLRALVSGQASGSLDVNYRGRSHHLQVAPLRHSELWPIREGSPWMLIVFQDKTLQQTMNLESLTLSSILFVLSSGILALLWGLVYLVWRRYPAKWFWPDESKRAAYLAIIAVNSVVAALFVAWIILVPPSVAVYGDAGIPAVAILLTFVLCSRTKAEPARLDSGDAGRSRSNLPRFPDALRSALLPGWQSEHAWAKVSLLIVAAVLPCFGFFKLAHDFEMRLLIKRGQIRLAERLDDRRTRIKEDYKRLDLDRQYATLLENRIQESGEEPLDVYAWPFFNTTIEPVSPEPHGTEEKDLFDNRLQWALAAFRPLYNYVAVETHGLIASSLKDRSLQWSSGSENELVYTEFANDTGNTRRIRSVWKPLSLSWGPWWWLGVVVAIVGLFLFVRFVAAWIYPVSLRESPVRTDPPELARNICTNSSTNWLVVGPPHCGKSEWLKSVLPPKGIVDLAKEARADNWAEEFNYYALPAGLVAVDHFEYRIDDPRCNAQKLSLLEGLIFGQKQNVLVVSAVDPLFYFTNGCSGNAGEEQAEVHLDECSPNRNLERWARVLSSFAKRSFAVADDSFGGIVQQFSGQALGLGRDNSRALADLFESECRPSPRLRSIGKEIVSDLPTGVAMDSEQLISEVLDRADAYYRACWATCSKSEKLALVQLAQEGLVNPKSREAISQLLRKGFVVSKSAGSGRPAGLGPGATSSPGKGRLTMQVPVFRVMNESFRRFAASALPSATIAAWEHEGAGLPWPVVRALLLTLAVVGALFLYLTQENLFEAWMAYASGFVAAIPALLKFFGVFRGRHAQE